MGDGMTEITKERLQASVDFVTSIQKKLDAAGIKRSGVNDKGVVWDIDGVTEIQDREDVKAALAAELKEEPVAETCTIEERVSSLELRIKQLEEK